MVIDFFVGAALLVALYWLPGLVWLRRSQLDPATRAVVGAAVSYAVMTAVGVGLGAVGLLDRPWLVVAWIGVVGGAMTWPVRQGWFDRLHADVGWPLAAAAGFGVLLFVQGLRPGIFRLNDALSVWAPLAADIGDSGIIDPEWLPTMVEGFPPSVALVTGSISLLAGGFAETHGFIVHPFFATLLLATAVLLGGWFGGKYGAWLTLVVVLSTPLLVRGLMLHDDLLAAFLTAVAVLLALRAKSDGGWVLVGVAVGGAIAVKHLGLVAILLVAVVLAARLASPRAWAAAAAGATVGLPWYLWNVVRFGNPVHPLLPGLFGEPDAVTRVVADSNAALRFEDRALFSEVGALTLGLLAVGAAAAVWHVTRPTTDPTRRRIVAGVLVSAAIFVLVWQVSGYATRHLWQFMPVLAAIGAGSVLSLTPRRHAPLIAGVAAGLLLAVTAWDVQRDYWGRQEPDDVAQTGVYRVLQGKWRDLRLAVSPPGDVFDLFGNIAGAWDVLEAEPAGPLVFSFDHRRYYIPQHILSGADVRALPVYDAADADGRHGALREAGVGYVLDRRARGLRHPLFAEGPWEELAVRTDLYTELYSRGGLRLYEVRPAP